MEQNMVAYIEYVEIPAILLLGQEQSVTETQKDNLSSQYQVEKR